MLGERQMRTDHGNVPMTEQKRPAPDSSLRQTFTVIVLFILGTLALAMLQLVLDH